MSDHQPSSLEPLLFNKSHSIKNKNAKGRDTKGQKVIHILDDNNTVVFCDKPEDVGEVRAQYRAISDTVNSVHVSKKKQVPRRKKKEKEVIEDVPEIETTHELE